MKHSFDSEDKMGRKRRPPEKKTGGGSQKVDFSRFFSRGASPNKQFWAPHETECVWHCSSMVRGWGLYLPPLSQYYSMWDTVRDSSQLLLNLRWTSRDLWQGLVTNLKSWVVVCWLSQHDASVVVVWWQYNPLSPASPTVRSWCIPASSLVGKRLTARQPQWL